ncbi:MAG TPA: SlyX family protein [Pseudomonadales bacterium]
MTESPMQARIVELETRQAFQDDALASLNEALVNQQQRIAHLEQMLGLVVERVRASELELDLPAVEPPPPHY